MTLFGTAGAASNQVEESPEAVAKAWDEEIGRHVADMEAGRTRWTPADEVVTRLRTRISTAKANAGQS